MESVGFKEWTLVCETLGCGEQSIILRKGGIAEGGEGFAFRDTEFFLFPTYFHEQVERTRGEATQIPSQRAGEIEIKYFARLEFAAFVSSWEEVLALEPFHILKREVVRDRFEYEGAVGIHVGLVRVYRLKPGWIFPDAPRYGGCRSWVRLPESPQGMKFESVLDDDEHRERSEAVKAIVATSAIQSS